MVAHGSSGPWEWRPLRMFDPGSGGPWEWRPVTKCSSVLEPENARKLAKLAKFFFVVCEPRKFLSHKTKKGRQKFSREHVEIFWWSANREKVCQVVRESEKVGNCWRRPNKCFNTILVWHCIHDIVQVFLQELCFNLSWPSSASFLLGWQALIPPSSHSNHAAPCILSCCPFDLEFTPLRDLIATNNVPSKLCACAGAQRL